MFGIEIDLQLPPAILKAAESSVKSLQQMNDFVWIQTFGLGVLTGLAACFVLWILTSRNK